MKRLTIDIEILDYWHAGSGRSRGAALDAEVVRDEAGLPYVPGRTLRGLLREGLTLANDCEIAPVDVDDLFGQPHTRGRLRVSDARLPADLCAWAKAKADTGVRDALVDEIASTAIDHETGVAQSGTLRVIEVAVPMTLSAEIVIENPGAGDVEGLQLAASLVRGLGTSRRRGLGRATLTVRETAQ